MAQESPPASSPAATARSIEAGSVAQEIDARVLALLKSRRDPEARAHAGSLRNTRNERGQPRD